MYFVEKKAKRANRLDFQIFKNPNCLHERGYEIKYRISHFVMAIGSAAANFQKFSFGIKNAGFVHLPFTPHGAPRA